MGYFSKDTNIWCSRGEYITIERLLENTDVFAIDSYDFEQMNFRTARARLNLGRKLETISVNYSDGNKNYTVRCTPDTEFLVYSPVRGLYWRNVEDLTKGVLLFSRGSDLGCNKVVYLVVDSVEYLDEVEDTYYLDLGRLDNFTIDGGVVVSSCIDNGIKLRLVNNQLLEGTDLDLDVTQDLLDKYFSDTGKVNLSDVDDEVDRCIDVLVTDLNLELSYGGDDCLYTLAVVLECINSSSDVTEFEKDLSINTPFKSSCSGFVMFILCQLEAGGFIHDTKYRQLTEKGKLLLWLFRHFEFVDTII